MEWPSSFAKVQGVKVRYVKQGAGPPVILLHGLGVSLVAWSANIGPLSTKHTVYALDLPGHGESEKPIGLGYDAVAGAHFLAWFMHELGIARASLIGNSAGGAVAARCALLYPKRVERLVLVAPAGLGRELRWFLRLSSLPLLGELLDMLSVRNARNMMRSIFYQDHPFSDSLAQELMRVRNLPGAKKVMLKVLRSSVNIMGLRKEAQVLEKLGRLDTPILILWGTEDRIIPVSHAYRAAKVLSRAQVHIIPNCGHWPQMERAAEFNPLVLQFLEGTTDEKLGD